MKILLLLLITSFLPLKLGIEWHYLIPKEDVLEGDEVEIVPGEWIKSNNWATDLRYGPQTKGLRYRRAKLNPNNLPETQTVKR